MPTMSVPTPKSRKRDRQAPGMPGVPVPVPALCDDMEGHLFSFYLSTGDPAYTPRVSPVPVRHQGVQNMALHLGEPTDNTVLYGKAAKKARRLVRVQARLSTHALPTSLDTMFDDLDLDDKVYRGCIFHLIHQRHMPVPQNYRQAMSSSQSAEWSTAMDSEHNSLLAHDTWILVELPRNRKVLKTRWVYTVKYLANGEVDRHKARLCVQGFLQKYGIDYVETFAPVVRMEVLRLILSIAAVLDWEIHQMDVKTAFLNGVLEEEIYVSQPEGYKIRGKEHLVCKLIKSLYGLKQAPRVWHVALTEFLLSCGFRQLVIDRCVFVRTVDGDTCIVSAYVDDLLLVANTMKVMDHFKTQLNARFKMTDLGEIHFLLGWHITRDRDRRLLFINQEKYAEKVLEAYQHDKSRAGTIPMDAHTILRVADRPTSDEGVRAMDRYPYRQVIGSLMYLMIGTRPDLATVIRETSQHLSNPGKVHWDALTKALRYLRGTSTHGIRLGGRHGLEMLRNGDFLSAYCDADFANAESRRSVTGYVTHLFGDSPISWRSQMQSLVTLSSTEAEYVALSACVQEVKYLRTLLMELRFPQTAPVTIHEDNQSCIKLVKNPESHGRTKHIDIKYHFIREAFASHVIVVIYCPTSDMRADTMTKSLPFPAFSKHRSGISVLAYTEVFGGHVVHLLVPKMAL